jgi:hypothetical protein
VKEVSRFLLLLSTLLLCACSAPRPLPVAPADAQKIVFQAVTSNKAHLTIASYALLGEQPGFNGYVVAFWMCQPKSTNSGAISISGYAVVRKYWMSQGIQAMSELSAGLPAAGSLVEFAASTQDDRDGNGKRNIVYGRVLSPQVQAIEVVYADKHTLRWAVSGNGFLLFRDEPTDWLRLSILGADDQVLKTYDLTQSAEILSERAGPWEQNCPQTQ